jgi:hypothetical protein
MRQETKGKEKPRETFEKVSHFQTFTFLKVAQALACGNIRCGLRPVNIRPAEELE